MTAWLSRKKGMLIKSISVISRFHFTHYLSTDWKMDFQAANLEIYRQIIVLMEWMSPLPTPVHFCNQYTVFSSSSIFEVSWNVNTVAHLIGLIFSKTRDFSTQSIATKSHSNFVIPFDHHQDKKQLISTL